MGIQVCYKKKDEHQSWKLARKTQPPFPYIYALSSWLKNEVAYNVYVLTLNISTSTNSRSVYVHFSSEEKMLIINDNSNQKIWM